MIRQAELAYQVSQCELSLEYPTHTGEGGKGEGENVERERKLVRETRRKARKMDEKTNR